MAVFYEQNLDRFDNDVTAGEAWRNNKQFRDEFELWLIDPVTLATYAFDFDPYSVNGLPLIVLSPDQANVVREIFDEWLLRNK